MPGFGDEGANSDFCVDIDECQEPGLNNCHPMANCMNKEGTFACKCKPGYSGDGVRSCIDTSACSKGTHNCHKSASCVDTEEGYMCQCDEGYSGSGRQNDKCRDIDECELEIDNCHEKAKCKNTIGGQSLTKQLKVS